MPDAVATAELRSVMVVDDEPQMIRICESLLSRERFSVTSFADAREALADLKTRPRPPDALLTDLHMPGMSGLELLGAVRELWPTLPTVMMTGRATVAAAVEAMRLGAYDYVVKPFEPIDVVVAALRRAIEHKELLEHNRSLQLRLAERDRFDEIVGSSTAMQEIRSAIASIAPTDAAVLLVGEGGTGKELCARAIHKTSLRSGRAFVAVDCSAQSPSMLEGELFGHARAFAGAPSARRGLFEEAAGGSVFLDQIGKLRASTQALILRVLQERQIRSIGSNESRGVDVRILAANDHPLAPAVEQGSFRRDLYLRLHAVRLELPPLRERSEDIPLLVQHFIAKHSARHKKALNGIDGPALERLRRSSWPGNVRALESAIERAVVRARGDVITGELLPPELDRPLGAVAGDGPMRSLVDARDNFELEYLRRALAQAEGNISQAARIAGVDRSNLKRMLKRHNLL